MTWLAFSIRPLTLRELAEASIVDSTSSQPVKKSQRYLNPKDVLKFLPGLVTIDYSIDSDVFQTSPSNDEVKKYGIVRLAHFSVKEYLVSKRIQDS